MTTELIQQAAAMIKKQIWNSDAMGFVLTLNDDREICVQYEIQDDAINFSNGYPRGFICCYRAQRMFR